ncbi:hypothetical protein [Eoetvoesiella caeni]
MPRQNIEIIQTPEEDPMRSQLDLFELTEPDPRKQNPYSNTIELYDALLKYNWDEREIDDIQTAGYVRSIRIGGQDYVTKVTPALIQRGSKKVLIYPGTREEIVEQALRKFVVDGQGRISGGEVGVTFTMYQLQKELASRGRTMDLAELSEAIEVCHGAQLECTTQGGKKVVSSNFFPTIAITRRDEYEAAPGEARCYVRFNPLVTESIINLTFRQYNYEIGMSITSRLARYMHRRMSHYWTQASENDPYTLSLVTFLEQSPRGLSKLMAENIRAMKSALTALINHKIVSTYDEERIKKGRSIVDVKYAIYPHKDFISQMIASNRHHNSLRIKAIKGNLQVAKKPGTKKKKQNITDEP